MKIALIDDHKILMDGIEALLEMQEGLQVIVKKESGQELIDSVEMTSLDLIVMDFNMKGEDGIKVLERLKKMGFDGKCIFLSSYNDLKLVNEAMHTGAHGYVTKNSATEYLVEAIDQVSKGHQYYSPDIKERILNAFTNPSSKSDDDIEERSSVRQLTEREREVLKLIAMQYTSEEISKKLFIAKSTVDTHRKNLIHKLKVKNAVGLGLFAERNGLI